MQRRRNPTAELLPLSELVAHLPRGRSQPWRLNRGYDASRLGPAALCLVFFFVMAMSIDASPRRTGDAHQYLAMARQLSLLRPPSLTPSEEADYRAWLMAHHPASGFPDGVTAVHQPALVRHGRLEFSHFWVYPLLAAPATALANALAIHPLAAFTATNLAFLASALWAAARTFGPTTTLVVLASPLVWFVARAQVEIFTFALLSLAMAAAATRRWGWASLAIALAATQNLPIAAAIPLVWVIAAVDWIAGQKSTHRSLRPSRGKVSRALAFAALAVAVSLLHPIYYLARLGVVTPQQLNGGIAANVPSPTRYLAPLIDPDIGFLAWLPVHVLLALAGAILLVRSMRHSGLQQKHLGLAALCGIGMAIWFLFVFAQTTNVNSGGTVHISRYALWLLPLTLPLIAAAINTLDRRFPAVALAASLALFAAYAVIFQPDRPERYVEHSPQAAWLIDRAPELYHPLPEIFVERTLHIDGGPRRSAADPACRMVFLLAAQPDQPCPLSAPEQAAIAARISAGDEAVWVRRAGDGASAVVTALPER